MTDDELREATAFVKYTMSISAPYRTGNLAMNSIRVVYPERNVGEVYVDTKIAPYMPYTNEPWLSPRWNGKKNPNEEWWNAAAETAAYALAHYLGGSVE